MNMGFFLYVLIIFLLSPVITFAWHLWLMEKYFWGTGVCKTSVSFNLFIHFIAFYMFIASATILLQIFHNVSVTTCLNREGLLYIRHSSLGTHDLLVPNRLGTVWNVKYQNPNIFKPFVFNQNAIGYRARITYSDSLQSVHWENKSELLSRLMNMTNTTFSRTGNQSVGYL